MLTPETAYGNRSFTDATAAAASSASKGTKKKAATSTTAVRPSQPATTTVAPQRYTPMSPENAYGNRSFNDARTAAVTTPAPASGPRTISLHPAGAEVQPTETEVRPAATAAAMPTPSQPVAGAPDYGAMPPSAHVGSSNGGISRDLRTPVTPHKTHTIEPVLKKEPEPVLDPYGLPQYDASGKPLFKPTVYQLRDKHGKPVVDADGNPVFQSEGNLGFDERGHLIKAPKAQHVVESGPKTNVVIEHGALSVNGIVGKVRLNYDIGNLDYLYIYVPDIGVTVVSDRYFAGSEVQKNAFKGDTLSVHVDGKLLQVSSEQPLLGNRPKPAYVMVDRAYMLPDKFPVFGFGNTKLQPYMWPGSKVDTSYVAKHAPKVIEGLKPKLAATDSAAATPTATPAAKQ